MPDTATACRHHWMIETPNGVTSRGVCKRCGLERDFPSAGSDATPNRQQRAIIASEVKRAQAQGREVYPARDQKGLS